MISVNLYLTFFKIPETLKGLRSVANGKKAKFAQTSIETDF